MFHYYDLEKEEIMNTNIFSIHYMCVPIIIEFLIYLYFLFILILHFTFA